MNRVLQVVMVLLGHPVKLDHKVPLVKMATPVILENLVVPEKKDTRDPKVNKDPPDHLVTKEMSDNLDHLVMMVLLVLVVHKVH